MPRIAIARNDRDCCPVITGLGRRIPQHDRSSRHVLLHLAQRRSRSNENVAGRKLRPRAPETATHAKLAQGRDKRERVGAPARSFGKMLQPRSRKRRNAQELCRCLTPRTHGAIYGRARPSISAVGQVQQILPFFQQDRHRARNHIDPQPSPPIPIDGYQTVKRGSRSLGSHSIAQIQLSKSKRIFVALEQQNGRGWQSITVVIVPGPRSDSDVTTALRASLAPDALGHARVPSARFQAARSAPTCLDRVSGIARGSPPGSEVEQD